MNLDTAIRVKEAYRGNSFCNLNKVEKEADQLSIEALEREQRNRADPKYVLVGELPGETKY